MPKKCRNLNLRALIPLYSVFPLKVAMYGLSSVVPYLRCIPVEERGLMAMRQPWFACKFKSVRRTQRLHKHLTQRSNATRPLLSPKTLLSCHIIYSMSSNNLGITFITAPLPLLTEEDCSLHGTVTYLSNLVVFEVYLGQTNISNSY